MLIPDYNVGQNGILMFGHESGMPLPGAQALGAAPTLQIAGYGNVPNITRSEGAQVINAVGSYSGVATMPGNRDPGGRISLKIGNADFLSYGLRSSGITPNYKCLPVIAVAGGASAACSDGSGFTWLLRHGLINGININFSEGQPVMADVDFQGIALDPDAVTQSPMDFSTLESIKQSVLTWFHTSFIIAGVDYRNYLKSVSLQISNNVQMLGGYRNDFGWNNAFSRTRQALAPGLETVNVTYQLHAKLAPTLIDAAIAAGNWGAVVLRASDTAVNSVNPKTASFTISNNMLNSLELSAVEAGQPFGYTAQTVGRLVSLAVR